MGDLTPGRAQLYHRRWEMQALYDELKTHLHNRRRVLRSKTADLVLQECYGWVLTHYTVRWLVHQGAVKHRIPHEDLSFTEHVELIRREQPLSGAFPPGAAEKTGPVVRRLARRVRQAARQPDHQPPPAPHGQAAKLALQGLRLGCPQTCAH
jgi:hypothetical protein